MNLHSDYPFWLVKEGVLTDYPRLQKDTETGALIIGGGISGALIGHELAKRSIASIIVDKRHIGFGSTSSSTALLQYEIDNPLYRLSGEIGEARAVRSFELGVEAIDKLAAVCERILGKADFRRRQSLWYASYAKDVKETIEPEFRARKRAGLDVRLLGGDDVRRTFGFAAPAAILSKAGATCHPYKLTDALLHDFHSIGGRVYDLTKVVGWSETKNRIEVSTAGGPRIRARHVIVAAGYETQGFLDRRVTSFHSTYAIASKPGGARDPWHRSAMIWETKTPYLYLRTAADGRIFVGGRDEEFSDPRKRDALIGRKSRQLLGDFRKLFPDVPFEIDFA